MVCKKCGRSFNDNSSTCPFCGVGQENQINIKKLENELEKLKIEDKASSFYDVTNDDLEIFDIEDIIDDLEELKIKDEKKDETPVPRVEPISDEEIIDLIADINENKELFITDKSQYQYIPKKQKEQEFSDNNTENIGLNDLFKKQKLYNPEELRVEKKYEIELPEILKINRKEKSYKKEIIISSIVLIVIAFMALFFVYQYMFSPKTKLIKDISSKYIKIQEIIDKSTTNFIELLKHNDVSINSTYNINTKDNKESYSEIINLKYIENRLDKSQYYEYTNFNKYKSEYNKMFILNNKLYVNKENLTNEFYSTDARFISILNINNDDSKYLFNKLVDSLKNNIKNNNFKVKTVNENKSKLKEISLTLDEKLYSEIYSSFLNEIKEDDKALEIIKDNFQYSNVELMTEINNKLEELKTKTSNKDILTYKFYINDDNEIVKYSINYNNTDITLLINKDEMELTINQNKEEILYLKLKSTDERLNRYNIILNYDNYQLSGDYYEEDNRIIFNYQKKYGTDTDKEIVNLVLTKGEKEDKKYTNNIFIAYQKTENNNVINKTVNGTNIIEADTEIPILDVSNNVKVMEDALRNELKEKFSMFIK